MFDQTTRHLTAQLAKAEEVKKEVQNANQNATTSQITTSESLELLLREERDRALLDRQSLIEQMTSLINTTAASQEARLVSRFGDVQTDMATTIATSKANTDVIVGKLENWVGDEETFKTSLVQTRDGLKKRLQTDFAVSLYLSYYHKHQRLTSSYRILKHTTTLSKVLPKPSMPRRCILWTLKWRMFLLKCKLLMTL